MAEEIGKRVRLILTNGFHYTGTILESDDSAIILKDKFGREVRLLKNSIMVWEENGR